MQTETTLEAWTLPPCYIGAHWDGYLVAPVGRTRDSDALGRANFDEQWARLEPLRADVPGDDVSAPLIVRENHWAVGWIEWVAIHPSNEAAVKAAVKAAEEMARRMDSYPVLSEDRFSEYEMEEYQEGWEAWGKRDFAKACQAAFGLSDAATDALQDAPGLQDAYEAGIPSGDFMRMERDTLQRSADRAEFTRDQVAALIREGRKA